MRFDEALALSMESVLYSLLSATLCTIISEFLARAESNGPTMESDRQPKNMNLPGLESLGLRSFLHLPQDTDKDAPTPSETTGSGSTLPPRTSTNHPLSSQRHQLARQLAREHARRLRIKSSVGPSSGARRGRSYLRSQKYLEYRARRCRGTGKDGDVVWSDELEDAFQQGKSHFLFILASH